VSDEVANVTGRYFSDCKVRLRKLSVVNVTSSLSSYFQVAKETKQAQDDALAKKLWELSESLVGLKSEEKHF
jgi:retinol dehydrogenase 12